MARLRYNGLKATLGAALTSSGTTVTFAAALTHSNGTAVPTLSGGDVIPLSILTSGGDLAEIVHLTAYTTGATTGTIVRGREGTTGMAHPSGAPVRHAATVEDFTEPELSRARAYSSGTAPSVPNNTSTIIPLPSEEYDTNNLHDNVTNNSRITLDKAGAWMVFARVGLSGNSTGRRIAEVMRNGANAVSSSTTYPSSISPVYVSLSGFIVAAAGDHLELSVYQDSGSSLTIQNASSNATYLAAVHLGA